MNTSKENNNFTNNILEQAPVAIAIFRGNQFIIEFTNDYSLQILGKTNSIIGKPLFESFPELKEQGLKEILEKIMSTGNSYTVNEHEFLVKRNNKEEKLFLNCSYQPLREKDNIISGIIAVFSEITEQINTRKLIEDSEKRFSSMFMTSPFAFAILKGKNMVITMANETIKDIWGKGDAVIGKKLFEILPEVVHQGFPEIINKVYDTGNPFYGYEMLALVKRKQKIDKCYFNFVYQVHREVNNSIAGIAIIAYEVTEQVLAKKIVEENAQKFKLMTDLMPVKVSYGDADGKINYFNERWIEYTGLTLEELVTFGLDKITHPDDKKIVNKQWKNALKKGVKFEIEIRFLDKNQNYHWHLSKVKPIKESNGIISHWIGVNTEIHNQKTQNEILSEDIKQRNQELLLANQNLELKNLELKITKNKLQTQYSRKLIEASLDPLVAINTDGKIIDMNHAMVVITDKSREQLSNTNFCDYFTDPDKAKKIYEEVFEKGFVTNFPLIMKDGVLTNVLFNGSIYKNEKNEVVGAVVVARDITEQKKSEKELTRAKMIAELASSIAEEAKIIAEAATKKANEALKSKQQFLSNMSHEIRTPMNAIIGFTKVVLKTELTTKQKEYLNAIKMSGDSLIVLINDILDLAKVDNGKMIFEKKPFKLKMSIKAMLHLFETKIQEKNLKLIKHYDTEIPEVLVGDSVRLHQIILNLVSNAVKFTNEGKITVSIKLVSETKDDVAIKFSVTDTGIGISETKIEKIFENFQQATSSTSRIFGGTGLGLAIVKQLVEAQNGTVEVESFIGKGSTFSFTLHFGKTLIENFSEPEILTIDDEINDIKILIVEDMELNQLLMKTLLDDFGFEYEIAANGIIAIDKLKTNTYDIILMDLQMPEMNGFEATEYIRKEMNLKTPIIALTADVTTVDVTKCIAAGMNDYISKPVDERLLYNKLINFMKKPVVLIKNENDRDKEKKTIKYVDLSYLKSITKANPKLMAEMIRVYLNQTPPLLKAMKQSFIDKDYHLLKGTIHKMIPSFAIMGINAKYTESAKKIQEYAEKLELSIELNDLVSEIENVCLQSFIELENELIKLEKK